MANNLNDLDNANKAYEILKHYKGKNPYIYNLGKKVTVYNESLTKFQIDFVIKNYDFEPKLINKIITLADWYAETKQIEWEISFIPKRVQITHLIGELDGCYGVYLRYNQRQEQPILCFLSKKGILTALNVDDYNDLNIDFEKYDELSKDKRIKIKDFQKTAVKFLVSRKKAILADSQGYGKTIESIIAMLETNCNRALIICPASLKTNWKNELSNYVDKSEIEVISGKKWKENKYIIANYDILDNFYTVPQEIYYKKVNDYDNDGNIIQTKEISWKKKPIYDENGNILEEGVPRMKVSSNKELIRKAMEESQLFQSKFDLVIIDEVHKLCNSTSGRYKIIHDFLKRTNPNYIFLMSGTPISNRPLNFYNILKLIDADITKDYNLYIKRYCDAQLIYLKGEKWKWTKLFLEKKGKLFWTDLTDKEKEELDEFLLKYAKHVWKTTGASNLDELKERTKHIYLRRLTSEIKDMVTKQVNIIRYDLDKYQQEQYDKLWEDYLVNLDNAETKSQYKQVIESSLLRQYLAKEMIPNTIELAESILEESNKLIIMCSFDVEIEELKKHFKDKCVVYNGKMTLKQKDKAEYEFKNNDNVNVFIGNLIASGVGLNLQVAHNLIFNSFSWVSGDNLQSEDRIFRQTQTDDCFIYYQVFRNTFSEEMFDKVLNKEENINNIIKKESDK